MYDGKMLRSNQARGKGLPLEDENTAVGRMQ